MKLLLNYANFDLYEAQAEELVGYPPSLLQANPDGTANVRMSRVKKLLPNILQSLRRIDSLFTISSDGRIMTGHHRQAALIRAIRENPLIGKEIVLFAKVKIASTTHEAQKKIINANNGARVSYINQMCSKSNTLPISQRVVRPTLKAVESISFSKKIPTSQRRRLAVYLSEYFNNNEENVDLLRQNKPIKVTAEDIYNSRFTGVGNDNGFDTNPNCDLNDAVENIAIALTPCINVAGELIDRGIWYDKFGNNRTFLNMLVSWGFGGYLNNRKVREKIIENIEEFGSQMVPDLESSTINMNKKQDNVVKWVFCGTKVTPVVNIPKVSNDQEN